MKDYLFEKLYRKVDDYFLRNREWFNQFFILIEKFDREKEEFYYVEVERLFLERDKEIETVLEFFHSDKAKGDLTDTCHHTSIIYDKFKNNSLRIDDFKLINLNDYFKKVEDRTDDFVNYKRLLLKLKMRQYETDNIFYYSFPLIGFNKLQGSIHILFNADERKLTEIKINAIYKNTIVVFTEFYEQIYVDLKKTEKPNYRKLSEDASKNSFLQDFDYPRFYFSKSLNQEGFNDEQATIKELYKHEETYNSKMIIDLITKGETLKALEEIRRIVIKEDKEVFTTVINLKSRLALLNKEMMNGFISIEDYRNEINKLNYCILLLILEKIDS